MYAPPNEISVSGFKVQRKEAKHRDGSNEGSQYMFLLRNKKEKIFELSSIVLLICEG